VHCVSPLLAVVVFRELDLVVLGFR
jgi:hypothetical protein